MLVRRLLNQIERRDLLEKAMKRELESNDSRFRNWVRRLWIENTEERNEFHELPYSMEEYWQRYKWWLRREYRHQTREN